MKYNLSTVERPHRQTPRRLRGTLAHRDERRGHGGALEADTQERDDEPPAKKTRHNGELVVAEEGADGHASGLAGQRQR